MGTTMKSKLAAFQAKTLTDVRAKDETWFFSQLSEKCAEVIEKGKDFLIVCPFHNDHTPSCGVDRWHGYFKCFAGETEVITKHGIRQIRDLAGDKHYALIPKNGPLASLSGQGFHGAWQEVEFRSFGVQPLWEVLLSRNSVSKTIRATAEHRWFVRSGKNRKTNREVPTTGLRPYHSLTHLFPQSFALRRTKISAFGVAHGLVFGDGHLTAQSAQLTLFGEKALLLPYFPFTSSVPVTSQPDGTGVPGLRIGGLPRLFKTFPPLSESPSYLAGFLAGYFAADGCVSERGAIRINSAQKKNLVAFQGLCSLVGIGTFAIGHTIRTGKGKEPTPLYYLDLIGSTLRPEFFLRPGHRERFVNKQAAFERLGWVVKSVQPLNVQEEVFCAVVPGSHAFTLAGNILTGNCFSCGESGGWNKLANALDMERIDHSKEDVKTRTSRALERVGVRMKRAQKSRPLVEPWGKDAWRALDGGFLRDLGVVKVVDLKHNVLRIGLPVRNSTGALLGYTCRALEPENAEPKYTPLAADRNAWQDKELPTKSVLFLIDKAVKLDWDSFFLVEGPYDALRLWYGGVPAMATLGAGNWSDEKASMIIGLSPKKVFVMMDNDKAGAEAQASIIHCLRSSVRTVGIGLPCKDPGSLSDKQVQWLANKIKST